MEKEILHYIKDDHEIKFREIDVEDIFCFCLPSIYSPFHGWHLCFGEFSRSCPSNLGSAVIQGGRVCVRATTQIALAGHRTVLDYYERAPKANAAHNTDNYTSGPGTWPSYSNQTSLCSSDLEWKAAPTRKWWELSLPKRDTLKSLTHCLDSKMHPGPQPSQGWIV